MKEEIRPGDIVIVDQFIDRTKARAGVVLRRRRGRPRRLRRSGLQRPGGARRTRAAKRGRRARAPGRHLRGHRRADVLDARRVAALPQLGRRRHRHDQPARGQARARGGDLLRDHRAVDRLRLLARDRGGRHASRRWWRSSGRTWRWPSRSSRAAPSAFPTARTCACTRGRAARGHDRARRDSAGGARAARHSSWASTGAAKHERATDWSSSARWRSTRSRPTAPCTDDVLGGSASFFSTAASYFAPVKLVAVVGDDFPEAAPAVPRRARRRPRRARARAAARPSAGAGATPTTSAARTTLDTQLNVFADFKPQAARGVARRRVPLPRQHPSVAAARRARRR